ncbi:MAG: ferritin-like domain-containing protein [Nocardioidaceae bacterium]
MIERSAENDSDRRNFLKSASLAGLGVVGATTLSSVDAANAASSASRISDSAILNFALNLEYLEAEFYSYAVYGRGLPSKMTWGRGDKGPVIGGRMVNFKTKNIREYAREIAQDEIGHVEFLRQALGSAHVARPKIDIKNSFTAAARAAGLIGPRQTFDPYANENNFLLAAFIFEDVGVTAFKGAAPLISNKTYLSAAAGILAVEAYHAAVIRTNLYERGFEGPARKISDARDSLDGQREKDQGIGRPKRANLVPVNWNHLAYGRTAGQVLNVVYLTPDSKNKGGFFPAGVNGPIHTSDSH